MVWKKSILFALLLTLLFCLTLASCGGGGDSGGGGGDDDASGSPTTSEQVKNDAVSGVHAFLGTVRGLAPAARAQAVGAYMETQKAFQYVKVSDEGSVYAEFEDGSPYFVIVNRQLAPEDRAILEIPPSYYQDPEASNILGNVARIPEKKPVVLAAGLDYYDRSMFNPNTPRTGATPHMLEIANMFVLRANYQLSSAVDCTYEGLKRVKDVKPAVMYLNVHGAWEENRADVLVYAIPTLTPWPKHVTGDILSDAFQDRIVRVTATFIDKDNNEVELDVIGITEKFVKNYWAFAKDAVVYIDGCFSGGDNVSFRQAIIDKGAGCVVGWKGVVNAGNVYPATTAFFDRMTGFNSDTKVKPSQRPFPAQQVRPELQKEGYSVSMMTIFPETPTGGLLVPSIERIIISERTYEDDSGNPVDQSTMKIKGLFGSAQGHIIKVTVNAQEMSNVKINNGSDGNIEDIECDLPMNPAHAGFAGKVVVSIDRHKSNAVNLTLWHWKLHQTFIDNHGSVNFTQHVYWDLYIRSDVHPYRTEAGGDMQQPESVAFIAAPGSKATFTFVTSGEEGLTSSPVSGTIPYGIRNSGGLAKGYVFEGTINVMEGKFSVDNFFGYPITLSNQIRLSLWPDDAYIGWPGVPDDITFYFTSDYNIQGGNKPGTIPVTTTNLQYDDCTPAHKPGASISLAGEDVNFP